MTRDLDELHELEDLLQKILDDYPNTDVLRHALALNSARIARILWPELLDLIRTNKEDQKMTPRNESDPVQDKIDRALAAAGVLPPLRAVNPAPDYSKQMSIGEYIRRELKKWSAPMQIVAGPDSGPREGRPAPQRVAEDTELLERTRHVRKPKETMMQFYVRIGLGPGQIRGMSREEITRFVETVMQNDDLPRLEAPMFEPKPLPKRLIIDLW